MLGYAKAFHLFQALRISVIYKILVEIICGFQSCQEVCVLLWISLRSHNRNHLRSLMVLFAFS